MMGQKYTFFFAAKEGRLSDLVWVLNQKNASPNIRDGESQSTALHITCARGHAKCAEALIKAGTYELHFVNLFLIVVVHSCLI